MIEFLRRDLQAEALKLDNVLMVNFETPRQNAEPEQDAERRPRVAAVRLRGTQLVDHHEACTLIAGRRHLFDMEVRLQQRRGDGDHYGRLVRVRLSWAGDHLVVMSGSDDGELDATLHRQLVALVRSAATRPLAEDDLTFMLRKIELRAAEPGEDAAPDILGPDARLDAAS